MHCTLMRQSLAGQQPACPFSAYPSYLGVTGCRHEVRCSYWTHCLQVAADGSDEDRVYGAYSAVMMTDAQAMQVLAASHLAAP